MEWKPPDTIILSGREWRAGNDGAAGHSIGLAGGTSPELRLLGALCSLDWLGMEVMFNKMG
jgi:hypothetical protein